MLWVEVSTGDWRGASVNDRGVPIKGLIEQREELAQQRDKGVDSFREDIVALLILMMR